MQKPARRYLRWALRLLGPALLLVVVLRLPRPGEILDIVARSNRGLLLGAMALNMLSIQLKVTRWQELLRARQIAYPWKQAWVAFSASLYLGMLTPGRVGDVLRIQYLRHDKGTSYAEGLASVVMDRVCDLYVLVGFFAIAIARYGAQVIPELRFTAWLMVLAAVLGPALLLAPGLVERVFGALYRRLARDPGGAGLEVFLASLRGQARRSIPIAIPLTIAAYLVSFAQAWMIARAMAIPLPYFDVICLTAIASMLSLLPVSVSGIGVREVFFAAVFPSLGYAAEHGVTYGLMVFALLYLGVAAIGFVAWQIRPPPESAP